jgi:site-specific recombinase XerD
MKASNHAKAIVETSGSRGDLMKRVKKDEQGLYVIDFSAATCKITKKMTFHTARHTFATTVTLSNGVPVETVGGMLGHNITRGK